MARDNDTISDDAISNDPTNKAIDYGDNMLDNGEGKDKFDNNLDNSGNEEEDKDKEEDYEGEDNNADDNDDDDNEEEEDKKQDNDDE